MLEDGSGVVDDLIRDEGIVHLSQVTIIELLSTLKRLEAVERVIAPELFADLVLSFWNDVEVGALSVVDVTSEAVGMAGELLEKLYLTPIDALQVATAMLLQREFGGITFVCADAKLNAAVRSVGLQALDPLSQETAPPQ